MQKIIRAISYALNGLRFAFVNERNFKIEVACAFITIMLGFVIRISIASWLIIILNIGFVLTAELFNTAIEKLSDIVCKDFNPLIKIIKDISAAAVIVAVLIAFVSGLVIFIPSILKLCYV